MQLQEIYTPEVVCCSRESSASEAAALMRRHHVGALVVVNHVEHDRTPIGLITDRDLVIEVLAEGLDARHTAVVTLMRKPVIIARDTEEISAVIARMSNHGVRRMPVVDGGGMVVGIITLDDLLLTLVEQANALVQTNRQEMKAERQTRR